MLNTHSFQWSDLQKPQKTIDLNKFFETKAYQNLFSELKENKNHETDLDEDDSSTNAPESRTNSNLSGVENNAKEYNLVKIEEKPQENIKFLKLNERICKMLKEQTDKEILERFKHIAEYESQIISSNQIKIAKL